MQGEKKIISMKISAKNRELNLEEFKRQATKLIARPIGAWVSFTELCNLSCTHCQRNSYGYPKYAASEMPLDVFAKLEKDLFPFLDKCKVGGNNLGEQLLAKKWNYYFEKLAPYPFKCYLVTNGSLLNKNRIPQLLMSGWTIDFSTEGATKETYQSIRGWDFEKFISTVAECCEQKKNHKVSEALIRLSFTIFHDNAEELIKLIKIGAEIGVDEILVTHFLPLRESQRNQSLVYHKGIANSVFKESISLARELGISLKVPPPFSIQRMSEVENKPENESSQWAKKMCHHPWTSVSVNEKGEVMPCCLFDKPMGNLRETSFERIWNGQKYQRVRKTVNSTAPIGKCRNCPLRGREFTSDYCNNDSALLSVIGPTNPIATQFFLQLKMKEFLRKSKWGEKVFQQIKNLHKKYFY